MELRRQQAALLLGHLSKFPWMEHLTFARWTSQCTKATKTYLMPWPKCSAPSPWVSTTIKPTTCDPYFSIIFPSLFKPLLPQPCDSNYILIICKRVMHKHTHTKYQLNIYSSLDFTIYSLHLFYTKFFLLNLFHYTDFSFLLFISFFSNPLVQVCRNLIILYGCNTRKEIEQGT